MGKTFTLFHVLLFLFCVSFGSAQQYVKTPLSDLFLLEKGNSDDSFTVNSICVNDLLTNHPLSLMIAVNIEGNRRVLSFRRQRILNNKYRIQSSKAVFKQAAQKIFYTCKVDGQNDSSAFLTISKKEISFIIRISGRQWVFEKRKSQNSSFSNYVLSELVPQKRKNGFVCEASYEHLDKLSGRAKSIDSNVDSKVSIYFEADHALYLAKGSSITGVEDYVMNVFAQVAWIYANENIDIEISEIKVWDTPDPYDLSTTQNALNTFKTAIGASFNGDLAHLLSSNPADHGGKAFIDALCDKTRAFAYSNINGAYSGISDYSWDAFIIAHEMGHNFGSFHTHDCVWGSTGDMAIDDCGRTNETCGVINEDPLHGTIMSYCHLTTSGISFAEGFGQEPGDVIRSKYNACQAETGINCETAVTLTYNGKYQALGPITGYGASQLNADHANWFKFTPESAGKIKVFNCSSGVDSRLWIHSGSCEALLSIGFSDDNCGSVQGFQYASVIPQLFVEAGETIYIEWDDRWSSDGFDFWFKFGADIVE